MKAPVVATPSATWEIHKQILNTCIHILKYICECVFTKIQKNHIKTILLFRGLLSWNLLDYYLIHGCEDHIQFISPQPSLTPIVMFLESSTKHVSMVSQVHGSPASVVAFAPICNQTPDSIKIVKKSQNCCILLYENG